ncbi:dTDP-4-dehydrorhamnose reductase [Cladophialophora psammophila CBS 110553]|uniref:dTDP-4-dehydrorhamnose reductase n=1 Tax=Cladophialophora psammophila CBS 110553 TaxID=1182543 RepID=W9X6A5_9EURO|nr:dTDP-4-dehydrorhamnose reductase [Cladophialophora psammophila CBS 110553]EXJ75768.1 dTDP-4-dehydrorhamnose reductase [Cladophialophora psammophila CBS 110553]
MPSALVTGASGFLGRQVLNAFSDAGWNATGTGFSRASETVRKVDLQDADAVTKLFDQVKPQVVVHCAADRQPDSCTRNPEAAHKLNVTATEILASCAAKHNAFLIYISTDYVFPGIQGQAPYKPTDTPKPTNIYGQTKLDGETAVLQSPNNTVVLRVPVLYGPTSPKENNKESAVNVLMDSLWKSQNEKVKMDDWAIRYPTNVQDVARVCLDIAKLYTASPHPENLPRILQFSSEDRMTKYEITQKFAEIMGLSLDGIVPDKEGGKPAPDGTLRPYDCHLDTSELQRLGIDVSTVDFVAWWRRWVGAYRH